MRDVFQRRQAAFRRELVSYLRYVLNDHFVLFLFILLGLILTQYRALLLDPTAYRLFLLGLLPVVSAVCFVPGRMATYLRRGDEFFLLVQEAQVKVFLRGVFRKTAVLQLVRALLAFGLLLPLWWVTFADWLPILVYLLGLASLQFVAFAYRYRSLRQDAGLDWTFWISQEQERTQGILRFFSLFTQVKGIEERVRMRSTWNPVLPLLERGNSNPWYSLFLRSFLRKGPYYGLWLRLQLLALLALGLVPQVWLATGLAFVAYYLLYFQLLALLRSQDGQVMIGLFPKGSQAKSSGLRRLLNQLGLVSLGVALLVLLGRGAFLEAGSMLLFMLLLIKLYIPYKLKRLVDEAV
ncbi:ABC transporter permease [Streptococcus danieliae]|uniref:ABC transporter permease n=1 Tax=Streptococcus danieliae TaxID=747656 RepID=A0A7Z0LD65_9STRE|nr:ABC transporter permease [Streptococcus danieliae]MBF0717372.1 ABC transporter permease [Streptococcus danieliae]NYS49302.1 ABC transporter permease [Streptococcus danieliae]